MNTYIALLKGVNVGGHRKTPMASLRELLSKIGFKNVKTYIQSGNVVFQTKEIPRIQLENTIAKAIHVHFGFEVSVLVKSSSDLQRIIEACPFNEDEIKKSYFMMLHTAPSQELIQIASEKIYEGESYKIINDCLYYYSAKGMGKAKFNISYFERKLDTFATARNYNTMVKLVAMSNEI